MKSGRRLDRRSNPADPGRFEDQLVATHVNSSCSAPLLLSRSKVQSIQIQPIRLAHRYPFGSKHDFGTALRRAAFPRDESLKRLFPFVGENPMLGKALILVDS